MNGPMLAGGLQRWIVSVVLATGLGVPVVACSSDAASGQLSEAGARGRSVAASSGCSGCHGGDGRGGVGPAWIGLAGAEVELLDGSVVVADDAYIARAISDPGADLRAGYSMQMPQNRLTDEQIADVMAYIHDLSAPTRASGN